MQIERQPNPYQKNHRRERSFFLEKVVENHIERRTYQHQPITNKGTIQRPQTCHQKNGTQHPLRKECSQRLIANLNIRSRLQPRTALQVHGIRTNVSLTSCQALISPLKNQKGHMFRFGLQFVLYRNAKTLQPNPGRNIPGNNWRMSCLWIADQSSSSYQYSAFQRKRILSVCKLISESRHGT